MKFNGEYHNPELSIETIANYLNDLENIDSFFILERGNCSYLQCINYKENILIEERVYSEDCFKHYVLGHADQDNNYDTFEVDGFEINGFEGSDFEIDELAIGDKFFERFSNELFSIKEAINIFTDYYTNVPFENIIKRDVTNEFGNLKKGFVFIQWLNSAVSNFKENLNEFIGMIEPFIIDELKKDCVGRKIVFEVKNEVKNDENKLNKDIIDDENIEKKNIKCSAFQVIDVRWAVESIIEVAEKYEFLEDITLFKKNNMDDNDFFELNIDDFK